MSDPFTAPPPIRPPAAPAATPSVPTPPQYPTASLPGTTPQNPALQNPALQNPAPPFNAPPPTPPSGHGGRPDPTPQVRRTAAIVVTSLGALLLAAAATVFMVIAWDHLHLPGKVGVVGVASGISLFAGHQLRTQLSGVAAVLTHLGAVLAPLVAGAGAVALDADRPTVAVVGGVVGIVVLQLFDQMGSPILAAGRALACAGVAVGLGVWLGVSPALLLIVAAAAAALIQRWDESLTTALLATITPIVGWGAAFAEPGSLLPWINDLAAVNQWLTSIVALAALIVIGAQVWQLPAPRLASAEARWAATVATAIFAINVTAFADAALANPDIVLLGLAISVLAGRVAERIWARSIGIYLDAWTWAVSGVTWLALMSFDTPLSMQKTELITSTLLLVSWLLNDAFGPTSDTDRSSTSSRLLHGSSGPMSSVGIALTSISIAVATNHSLGAAIGLIALGALFTISRRAYRAELAMLTFAAALTAAIGSPVLFPAISIAVMASATHIMLTDLGRAVGPRVLRSLQAMSLLIAGCAVLLEVIITEPTWVSTSLHLLAFAGAAAALSRFTHVPDLLLPPRFMLVTPVVASFGDLGMAGAFAIITGVALVIDRSVHRVVESELLGLGLVTLGSWVLAADAGVMAPEVYVAMPCLVLAKVGHDIVRRGGSSWLGIAPALAIFTLVGILQRVDGNGGWHAVTAGAVAIAAMVVGVDRRWAGPSMIGALSLITVVGVETAAYVPAVPLWIWLALGGASLVGAGIYLERSADEEGTAPLKTAWAAFR